MFMIGTVERQPSLFYAAFGHQASLIKDDLLEPLDTLLEDPSLVALVTKALAGRHRRSSSRGRKGIAPDRLLRCCVLKHLKGWSFRELQRELRASLVYRRFTRFDEDGIPDFSTFSRTFSALGPDITHQIHARVVERARRERIAPGRRLRTDTTVVESNVHYPTDSTLLGDGIRVLTRSLQRIAQECQVGAVHIVDHARSTKHRILEIHRAAKSFTEASRDKMKDSYHKLVSIAGGVVRTAERAAQDLTSGALSITGEGMRVMEAQMQLDHFVPLVKRVLAQTKARVFGGDTHVADKVVSLFEEHTQVICKGKAHKPTEFGRLVRIDEVEHGIVSNYEVQDGNPSDEQAWMPALSQHKERFGKAPRLATADRGYSSRRNEQEAAALGVKQVALPARGKLSMARRTLQKQRWFKRALRWRSGIESRIATLKHRLGMARAQYKGDRGFKRYVGWCVIAQNLISISRVHRQRKKETDNGTQIPQAA